MTTDCHIRTYGRALRRRRSRSRREQPCPPPRRTGRTGPGEPLGQDRAAGSAPPATHRRVTGGGRSTVTTEALLRSHGAERRGQVRPGPAVRVHVCPEQRGQHPPAGGLPKVTPQAFNAVFRHMVQQARAFTAARRMRAPSDSTAHAAPVRPWRPGCRARSGCRKRKPGTRTARDTRRTLLSPCSGPRLRRTARRERGAPSGALGPAGSAGLAHPEVTLVYTLTRSHQSRLSGRTAPTAAGPGEQLPLRARPLCSEE